MIGRMKERTRAMRDARWVMRTYGVEHERGGERVLERVRVDVLRAQHALDGAVEVVAQVRLGAVRRAHRVREADDPA